jgi:hypothetical protein
MATGYVGGHADHTAKASMGMYHGYAVYHTGIADGGQEVVGVTYLETQPAAGGSTYTLTADAGSYLLTGNAGTNLEFHREIAAVAGSFSWSGSTADLLFNREIGADAGAYTINGGVVDFKYGLILNADAGSYALNGSTADLLADRVLSADTGSYALNGDAAALIWSGAEGEDNPKNWWNWRTMYTDGKFLVGKWLK